MSSLSALEELHASLEEFHRALEEVHRVREENNAVIRRITAENSCSERVLSRP